MGNRYRNENPIAEAILSRGWKKNLRDVVLAGVTLACLNTCGTEKRIDDLVCKSSFFDKTSGVYVSVYEDNSLAKTSGKQYWTIDEPEQCTVGGSYDMTVRDYRFVGSTSRISDNEDY